MGGPRERTRREDQKSRLRETSEAFWDRHRQYRADQGKLPNTPKIGPRHKEIKPHLKEEMGRHQCKNSSNNLKNHMVTPEPSKNKTGRLDHPNTQKEENIFKLNYM